MDQRARQFLSLVASRRKAGLRDLILKLLIRAPDRSSSGFAGPNERIQLGAVSFIKPAERVGLAEFSQKQLSSLGMDIELNPFGLVAQSGFAATFARRRRDQLPVHLFLSVQRD